MMTIGCKHIWQEIYKICKTESRGNHNSPITIKMFESTVKTQPI